MELQKIVAGEVKNEYEEEREPIKEAETEDKANFKKSEEAEPEHYSKLRTPSEDIYSEACYSDGPLTTTAGNQAKGNTRLYRPVCFLLAIICLALLLAVIILSVKLQTGSTECLARAATTNEIKMKDPLPSSCSYEECRAHFPEVQHQQCNCQQCAKGWLTFGQSCYFMSTYRLSWEASQRNCSARGGSLAVISSPSVQQFLTKEGKMKYWIGLRHHGNTWNWVDYTVLQESYWVDDRSDEGCGILSSGGSPEKNWITASCQFYTYFICQMQM